MKNKKVFLILMYKDYEVLSFEVTCGNRNKIRIIEKLKHFDKAPYEINEADSKGNINVALFNFFASRCIPSQRSDYKKIIKYTNSINAFELSFKGHGLSLSNHYWFKRENEDLKYEDINFFTNKWDDSFARAVLNDKYKDLMNVDLNVPDILTPGWGVKGWICEDDGPKLYKLGINKSHSEEAICEVLASRLANRILSEGEALKYELKKINKQYASVSPLMINIDEELISLSKAIDEKTYLLYRNKNLDKANWEQFLDAIKGSKIPGLYEFFIKLSCFRDLCFVSDLHFGNISFIKNNKTGEIRVAPLYDLGGAFGSTRTGKNLIANPNKATYILIYYLFNDFDPSWDYSWYDKDKLIGFEDEIRDMLSLSEFYSPQLIDSIIEVYHHQKALLDEMVESDK